MDNRRGWKGVFLVLLVFSALLSFLFTASAAENDTRTIRVGYPIQEGFTEINSDGSYGGYTYEYLQEIAQYTNWEYEFVTPEGALNDQLSELLTMLQAGEIDILGAMSYTDQLAELYSYPGYNYGTAYSTLAVLNSNITFTEFNYSTFKNIKVAVVSADGKENEKLNEFAAVNGFHAEQIICSSGKEQIQALETGRADAILQMDVSVERTNYRVIARFSPKPFYFAVTRGNLEVVSGINRALELINATNPYLTADLYKKYFDSDSNAVLSAAEQEFIEQMQPLKAGVLLDRAPFQYTGSDGKVRGISIEVMNYIEKETGLQFDIVTFDSPEAYAQALKGKEIDLAVGVTNDYNEAKVLGYTLTVPFDRVPLLIAVNDKVEDMSDLKGKKIALQTSAVEPEILFGTPTYYNTLEECLDAVHRGEADYCYGNSYSIQYYTSSHNYTNITTMVQPETWSRKYAFGITKPVDITLLSIINKSINSLPAGDINRYLYENAYDPGELTFADYIERNPKQATILLCSVWGVVMAGAFFGIEWARRRGAARKALENQRYEQLSELSNEFLYEYDIREDCINLTEQTAAFLGCPKKIGSSDRLRVDFPLFDYMISKQKSGKEQECLLPNGTSRWLKIVSKRVKDISGRPWYAVGKLIDIQTDREIKEKLEAEAMMDSLTRILNSAASRRLMKAILADENRAGTGAMVIMDIDYFKQVNDGLGHYTGDMVLIEAAEILRTCFRSGDIVGRLGGDEFVVFMRDVKTPEAVKQRCEEVLSRMKEISLKEHGKEITLSIGAAMAGDSADYDALYRRADQALYRVKKNGRNGIEIDSQMIELQP